MITYVEPIPVPIGLGQQGVVETYLEKCAVPILVFARPPHIAKAQKSGLIAMRTKWIMFSTAGFVPQELIQMNQARELWDHAVPPGNRLEALKGHPSGFHSIQVAIMDYH